MEYKMRIDKEADDYLPGIERGDCVVEVTDTRFCARMGRDFGAETDLATVREARVFDDPKPEIYLPLGISAAVERLGSDTIAAIGSYEGLVLIEFKEEIEARGTSKGLISAEQPTEESALMRVRRLILSLRDPQDLVQALSGRTDSGDRAASRPVSR